MHTLQFLYLLLFSINIFFTNEIMGINNQNITIKKSTTTKINEVDFSNLSFGENFTDHMFECDYIDGKWTNAQIRPYGPISLDPSAKVFHYGQAIFEGMKAYKSVDGAVWLFRPEDNLIRLNKSAVRLAIPEFPKDLFFDGMELLLNIDKEWIQTTEGSSMYIRPFIIATEPGVSASPAKRYKFMFILSPAQSYYSGEVKVLFADKFSRSASGGVGFAKCAGNYAGQFYPTKLANEAGYQQVVWTDSSTHEKLEEAGTMNVFFRVGDTLITAPTSDRILDGITRKSVIAIAEKEGYNVEVRDISVYEIEEAAKNGTLLEMFGAGTAAVINPIVSFHFKGNDYDLPKLENSYASIIKKKITDIQTGKAEDPFGWKYAVRSI
ncbi:branched-chain amino acid aminotransferase [Wenyingzhuangia marina]|uniref:Branched-chain-amino-acid aminotransferase n=2 Tax=Wenyingzhuangia marina TaxID=1195760 RepID=A0A1M5WQZ9_9FLAO|nr:branched-chain amino acid aminotransferase [Wenyingzhuangia marina]